MSSDSEIRPPEIRQPEAESISEMTRLLADLKAIEGSSSDKPEIVERVRSVLLILLDSKSLESSIELSDIGRQALKKGQLLPTTILYFREWVKTQLNTLRWLQT